MSAKTFTDKEKQILRQTWKQFNEGDKVENGAHMYFRLFSKYPETKKLFSFNDNEVIDESNYKVNTQFCNHVNKVFSDTLGTAVDGLDDLVGLGPILKDLGARHVKYGVTLEHYSILGECLIYALGHKLGSGFTKEVEKAWVDLFAFVELHMTAGMKGVN